MKKFQLSNGLQVINAGYCKDYAACIGFNVGDMNEPKTGIVFLFVRMLLMQKNGVLPYYGGVSTAFGLSGDDIDEVLVKLFDVTSVEITEETLAKAKAEIHQQISGRCRQVQQELRNMFHRLVSGVTTDQYDDSYLSFIDSYTVDDLKAFRDQYYTAANAVLLISGPDNVFYTSRKMVENLFGQMKSGVSQGGFVKKSYRGGFGHIDSTDGVNRVIMGWDLSKFPRGYNSAVEVMLQAFVKELRDAYIKAGLFNTIVDMRFVNYFGIYFMRVVVYSQNADLNSLSDVICAVVKRMCLEDYDGNIRPFNRVTPGCDDLSNVSELPEDKLFEVFDKVTGQTEGIVYDDSGGETSTGENLKLLARQFFLGSELTCVSVSAPNGDALLEQRLLKALKNIKKQIE